ncbi:hypothetical protein ABTF50_19795, partial [Acinetobacter baumannii]
MACRNDHNCRQTAVGRVNFVCRTRGMPETPTFRLLLTFPRQQESAAHVPITYRYAETTWSHHENP